MFGCIDETEQKNETEVSADAKYIAGRVVKHLWLVVVVVPVVLGILVALFRS